ncbi:hypothetical protein DCS_03775 [Drechmeria coniospora]|uniref:Xylanolytic transcriptional activator regulatory domain-containing protein n=1 Tax=Drechmeria coniospora TaxID=98403 RepID=A0A151GI72_DRECN|nr:hypothetical protein DCS_03775 [Drechmeria coniospora]KYK56769.1 hypothetical protein DCS_03775 [Drechmeria coniospora]ODA78406.1 hypothetical protein RJ55_05787 [Drechmeria coniospora]
MDGPGSSYAARRASSMSPTSPVSSRHGNGGTKRKRSSGLVAAESSPGSFMDDDHGDHDHADDKRRQPGVKRACNECRQQKMCPVTSRRGSSMRVPRLTATADGGQLRCDVIQDPFQSCSRCNRLKLECKIENNFKRVGKRSKHAEMEKEIDRLRRNVARARSQGFVQEDDDDVVSPAAGSTITTASFGHGHGHGHSQHHGHDHNHNANHNHNHNANHGRNHTHTRNPSLMGSDEAVSSLLHLKRGSYSVQQRYTHELEGVRLTDGNVTHLFNEFFAYYHPFLPFLTPQQPPEQYKQQHPLLFWSIIAVAARRYRPADAPDLLTNLSGPMTRYLWTTIGEVPSNYHVVKALCLLCTWPLPTSTTTSDPTHILCGVMMKTATGIGLHRPNHIRDFSRVSVELNKEQLHDRVTTWAVCNIVAQNIGTGYGQPASSLYDWTLALRPGDDPALHLSRDLEARLQIERFCDKVSKEMYSNASDPRGVAGDEHRAMLMRVYRRDFGELQASILSQQLGPIVNLHLRAAALHLRLAGFFDSSKTPGYMDDLMGLWRAATSFLDELLEVDNINSSHETTSTTLFYATNYVQQMLVAATFTLLKLMRSFFCKTIDFDRGRNLFLDAVRAIRTTSVVTNDLQWRLAELMAQMWNGARLDGRHQVFSEDDRANQVDDSLQLKVRCRHSMSLVFDSVWRWREEYQSQGRGSLENPKQSTSSEPANDSSVASSQLDSTLMPAHIPPTASNLLSANGALTPSAAALSTAVSGPNSMIGGSLSYGDANYDFFDPQHWMLDGLLDFNYSFVPPLEGA